MALDWLLANAGPETLKWWIDLLFHLDDQLHDLITQYGVWTHFILFAVIFCETGLVVTPFLPGDSLLFLAGGFAARGALNIYLLLPLLGIAAILGDSINYLLGSWIGEHAFNGKIPFLKKSHFEKTHAYFEKYGGKTIVIARFVPIVRTFAPFVAGIGSMNYRSFAFYNVIGGIFWVSAFLLPGYWLGTIQWVKDNFEWFAVGIIVISIMPPIYEWWVHRSQRKRAATAESLKAAE